MRFWRVLRWVSAFGVALLVMYSASLRADDSKEFEGQEGTEVSEPTADELLAQLPDPEFDADPAESMSPADREIKKTNDRKAQFLKYNERGLSCSLNSDCPILAECMGYMKGHKFGVCVCGYKDGCFKN